MESPVGFLLHGLGGCALIKIRGDAAEPENETTWILRSG
jgi:hypothetical protein